MAVKSDELSLSMVVPEGEKIPELVALPVEGDQQGMLQAAMGTTPSPSGSLWPCRALTPSSQSPLAVTLCPRGRRPCPHHAQAGAAGTKGWSLLFVAAAGMGSSVQPITDTAVLLCPTRGAWLDDTEPSPSSGALACSSNGNKSRRSCYGWLEEL